MPLGIITSIAACPAIIGMTEAVRQGQRQNYKEQHRSRKSNLLVTCHDPSRRSRDIHGGTVVLRNNKVRVPISSREIYQGMLYVTNVNPRHQHRTPQGVEDNVFQQGHLFAGYFFPYPESTWGRRGEGYVSTISDVPPQLNWIFVDRRTFEVKYGLRKDAEGHHVGPWNVTPIDRRLTFDGFEGFTVVEEAPDVWALYFDLRDDGLQGLVPSTQRIMEVELTRKEVRVVKGADLPE